MGSLSLELILGCLAAGATGMVVEKQTLALSLRLTGYKKPKKGERYKPYVFPRWKSWLYGAGLVITWAMTAYYYTSAYMVIVAALTLVALVIVYADSRYRVIANGITVPLMVFGLFFDLLQGGVKKATGSLLATTLGTLLCAAATVLTRKNQAVGAGDVKLMVVAAMVTRFYGFVYMIFFMAMIMKIYCVGGLLLKKFTLQSYFPVGGFIILGMALAFFEEQLMPILHLLIGRKKEWWDYGKVEVAGRGRRRTGDDGIYINFYVGGRYVNKYLNETWVKNGWFLHRGGSRILNQLIRSNIPGL